MGTALGVMLAVGLWMPGRAHAGGVLLGDGAAQTPGWLWMKVAFQSWSADERFAGIFDRDGQAGVELGDPIPFDRSTGGQLDSRALALDVRWVPVERLRVGVYMPVVQRTRFEDSTFVSTTTGTGDVRSFVGWELTDGGGPAHTTLVAQLEVPTTTLPVELETVPLGEGQFDASVGQISTWVPWRRVRLTMGTLLRRRFPLVEEERRLKPGDEAELMLRAVAAPVRWLWLSAAYEGLWSTGFEDRSGEGAVALRSRRQVHDLRAGVYLLWGGWIADELRGLALDASIAFPVAGRDFPRGVSYGVGLAWGRRVAMPWHEKPP
jgi:hypothetical protein